MATLTAAEKERVRYHLGYMNVQPVGSTSFGIPYPIQTLFILEDSMTNLIAETVPRVRALLNTLDGIECRMLSAQDRLAAISMGELKLRDDEPEMLEREYFRWAGRLADTLGAPFYAYSNRFKGKGASGGSIPVRNS